MELVVVIVILAVLGSIAMPRFFDHQVFAERGYYEELVAALKVAQKLAVASGCPVRITVDATAYDAQQQQPVSGRCDPAGAWSLPVRLGDGQPLAGTAPDKVTAAPAATIVFDALGRTNLAADQAIAVGSWTLTVRAGSGYVEAN